MSTKHLLRSFAGGEITPELAGRLDLVKYQTGLSLARNFITLPHGPATRRPGFEFIRPAGDSSRPVRLIPFTFIATGASGRNWASYGDAVDLSALAPDARALWQSLITDPQTSGGLLVACAPATGARAAVRLGRRPSSACRLAPDQGRP